MTVTEHKDRILGDLYDKVKQDIKECDQDLIEDDLYTLLIKENQQTQYGLRIKKKKFPKL